MEHESLDIVKKAMDEVVNSPIPKETALDRTIEKYEAHFGDTIPISGDEPEWKLIAIMHLCILTNISYEKMFGIDDTDDI